MTSGESDRRAVFEIRPHRTARRSATLTVPVSWYTPLASDGREEARAIPGRPGTHFAGADARPRSRRTPRESLQRIDRFPASPVADFDLRRCRRCFDPPIHYSCGQLSQRGSILWKEGAKKRLMKFILKFVLLVVVVGLIPASVWFVVTQPIVTMPSSAPTKAAPAAVDMARLEGHVRTLSQTLHPRNGGNRENMNRAAAYIRQEFQNAGGRVVEQAFDDEGSVYRNVSAHFGPETDERIVVGAHYDAFGDSPGADANAGGVAGLIELAGLLGKTGLKTQVELVAYALAQPPYWGTPRMGSAVHAFSLRTQNRSVRVMICLDMIGCFSDKEGSQKYPVQQLEWLYSSKGNFIAVVGNLGQIDEVRRIKTAMTGASPLPVLSVNAPLFFSGIDFSDHGNYWQADYRAVAITDTGALRNPNYRTARDTADTLDYKRMGMVVQGVHAAVIAFDR